MGWARVPLTKTPRDRADSIRATPSLDFSFILPDRDPKKFPQPTPFAVYTKYQPPPPNLVPPWGNALPEAPPPLTGKINLHIAQPNLVPWLSLGNPPPPPPPTLKLSIV